VSPLGHRISAGQSLYMSPEKDSGDPWAQYRREQDLGHILENSRRLRELAMELATLALQQVRDDPTRPSPTPDRPIRARSYVSTSNSLRAGHGRDPGRASSVRCSRVVVQCGHPPKYDSAILTPVTVAIGNR
jgi:hypothetical protein